MTGFTFGNAIDDGEDRRGWFVGQFMPDGDVRRSDDVEVKWGVHQAGETRESWQDDEERTTLLVLVEGRWRIHLSVDTYVLARPGDYAMWGPGIGHSWQAEADSTVITVRWPSIG